VRRITVADGLGSNYISDIGVDRSGFCWIATQTGLYYFDGNRVFTQPAPVELNNRRAVSLDFKNGFLSRVVTQRYFVNIRNGFVTITPKTYIFERAGSTPRNRAGEYFLEGSKRGLSILKHIDTSSFLYHLYNQNFYCNIGGFLADSVVGTLTNDGFAIFDTSGLKKQIKLKGFSPENSLVADGHMITITPSSILWIDRTGMIRSLGSSLGKGSFRILPNRDRGFFITRQDSLYYGQVKNGALEISFFLKHSTISRFSTASAWQNNSTVLFATGGEGVFIARTSGVHSYSPSDTLNEVQLLPILNDSIIYSGQNNRLVSSSGSVRFVQAWRGKDIAYVFRQSNGVIWLTCRERRDFVLFTADSIGGKLTRQSSELVNTTGMKELPDGSLLFLRNPYIFQLQNNVLRRRAIASKGLVERFVDAAFGIDGTVAVSSGNGLFATKPGDTVLYSVKGMKGREVRRVFLLPSGKILISTYGTGMFFYEDGKVTPVASDIQDKLLYVHDMIPYHGDLFFVTNNGIVGVKLALFEENLDSGNPMFQYWYLEEEAEKTNFEYNGGRYPLCILRGHRLLAPSSIGVRVVDLDRQMQQFAQEGFLSVTVAARDMKKEGNSYYFPPSLERVQIDVAAPFWSSNDNRRVFYCITNLAEKKSDTVWRPLGEQLVIDVLSAGKYPVGFRKYTGTARGEFVEKWILLDKEEYFYKTSKFSGLMFLLLTLCGMFAATVWRERVRKKNIQLRKLIADATAQVTRKNVVFSRLYKILHHDISGALSGVSQTLNLYAEHKGMAELSQYTKGIRIYLNDMLFWLAVSLEDGRVKVKKDRLELKPFLEALMQQERFSDLDRRLTVQLDINEELFLMTDNRALEIIAWNILTNAAKYGGGKLRIECSTDDKHIVIGFIDQGPGFPPHVLNKIDARIPKSNESGTSFRSGIGLDIILDLTELLEGQVVLKNGAAGGATILLRFPFSPSD